MTILATYQKRKPINYSAVVMTNKKVERFDPTRTSSLRMAFIKDMEKRFNRIAQLINQAVIQEDVFGLINPRDKFMTMAAPKTPLAQVGATPGNRAYAFARNPEKVTMFMDWLKEQEKKGLLQTTTINQLGTAAETPWTNVYISDSYKRGIQRARYELPNVPEWDKVKGIDVAFSTPFHADRVGLLYTRTFDDLIGVSSYMDTQISRTLAQGLIDGDNPRGLAKKLVEKTKMSLNRAKTIARTEIIRAHHTAMIQEYRNYGLAGVHVKAEWVTAGFNVCDKCMSLEGKFFTLDEIEGMIPAHPNCRCLALPAVVE